MIKRYKNKQVATALSTAIAIVFGLVMFIPVAQAEQPFDVTYCYSGAVTMVSASKQLTVFGAEVKGIIRSNHENKAFDNMTMHCMTIFRIVAGKATGTAYCKAIDPDGDIIVQEHTRVGSQSTWKFLQGTGKWKGITGGGTGKPITRGKPITPGTTQACSRVSGTFELPK
jgi:hypothetical protein